MLEKVGDTTVPSDTWDRWRAAAVDAVEGRTDFAIAIGLVTTLIPALIGLAVFDSGQFTVLVYSPLFALFAVPVARRWYVRRRFSETASAMRDLLVPHLLDAAPDDMLLHLLRFDGGAVPAEMKILKVQRESSATTIEVKRETQPGPGPRGWSQPTG